MIRPWLPVSALGRAACWPTRGEPACSASSSRYGEASVAAGSTANYFATRAALFEAIVERVPAAERAHFDQVAANPTSSAAPGRAIAGFARDATGGHRA